MNKTGPPFPIVIIGLVLLPFVAAHIFLWIILPILELWLRY